MGRPLRLSGGNSGQARSTRRPSKTRRHWFASGSMRGGVRRRGGWLPSSGVTTTADLADDLGVDEADVSLLLARLSEDDPDLTGGTLSVDTVSDYTASFIRQQLDPHGERTAPAGLYWPDAERTSAGLRTGRTEPNSPRWRQPAVVAHRGAEVRGTRPAGSSIDACGNSALGATAYKAVPRR